MTAEHPERLPTLDLLTLMNDLDREVPVAVGGVLPELAAAVDATVERMRAGGRLHYFGAGTSGRLAALDAAEVPPTFGVGPERVVAHLAGGSRALLEAIEGAEDGEDAGAAEVPAAGIGPADVVVGIAASGATPYVLGAMRAARLAGAFTVGIACTGDSPLAAAADLAISIVVGPEVVDGSTRLKAGTAQKLVLNMLSTAVFARLGHVVAGRMLDVRPTNAKLRRRAIGIIADLGGVDPQRAAEALDGSGDRTRLAIVMAARNLPAADAAALLEQSGGDLERALGARPAGGG